jgi:alkylation response protein AidB-like acyl-CoA dehydrogenase
MNNQFLTDEQKMIQQSAYDFAKKEIYPHAAEWEEKGHYDKSVMKKAAQLGFAGIYTSEKYGGSGLGRLEAVLIFEALATGKIHQKVFILACRMCANLSLPLSEQHVRVYA